MRLFVQIYMLIYVHKHAYICSYISALPIYSKNRPWKICTYISCSLGKDTHKDKFPLVPNLLRKRNYFRTFHSFKPQSLLQSSLTIHIYLSKYQIYPLKFQITSSDIFFHKIYSLTLHSGTQVKE